MQRVVGYIGCLSLVAVGVLAGVTDHASDLIVGSVAAAALAALVLSEDA